eukprot:gene9281-10246_t
MASLLLVDSDDDESEELVRTRELSVTQQRDLQSNLLSDLQLVSNLFQDDRVAEAWFLFRNIQALLRHLSPQGQDEVMKAMDAMSSIAALNKSGEEMMSLLTLLRTEQEWHVWNSSIGPHHDVVVHTHRLEKKGEHFVKLEGYLQAPIGLVCAALLEHDLYPLWTPICKKATCLGSLSLCRRVMELELDFVLIKRRAVCDLHLDILPDSSAIFISIHPLENVPKNESYLKGKNDLADLWGGILLQEVEIEVDEVLLTAPSSDNISIQTANKATPASSMKRVANSSSSLALLFNQAEEEKSTSSSITPMKTKYDNSSSSQNNITNNNPVPITPSSVAKKRSFLPQKSSLPAQSLESYLSAARAKMVRRKKKAVSCSVVLQTDLHLDFIPDWIFNLAVKSSLAMLLPMLEHQASLMAPEGPFHSRMQQNSELYNAIQTKLESFRSRSNSGLG